MWTINPLWLELIGSTEEIILRLKEFVELNTGTASVGVVWDTLKAYLKGSTISAGGKDKEKVKGMGGTGQKRGDGIRRTVRDRSNPRETRDMA